MRKVGEVEAAMQDSMDHLEARLTQQAKEMHRRLSKSLEQEMEVQRAEWNAAVAQSSDRLSALEAAIGDLQIKFGAGLEVRESLGALFQEQRREIGAVRELLGSSLPGRSTGCSARAPPPAALPTTTGVAPPKLSEAASHAPKPRSHAPGSELRAAASCVPDPGPRLLGRVRSHSPVKTQKNADGLLSDNLKESLQQVVSAVKRTLDDCEATQQPSPAAQQQTPATQQQSPATQQQSPPGEPMVPPEHLAATQQQSPDIRRAAPRTPQVMHRLPAMGWTGHAAHWPYAAAPTTPKLQLGTSQQAHILVSPRRC